MADRVGRRGGVLLVFAILDLVYGYALTTVPMVQHDVARNSSMLFNLAQPFVWGWVWLGFGVFLITSSVLRQGRDRLGFLAAFVLKAVWALGYLLGWVPLRQNSVGWQPASIWGAMAVLMLVVAGWKENERYGTGYRKVLTEYDENGG